MTERADAMRAALTVRDLIQILSSYPPDLPIYLADWNEEYAEDWPLTAESLHVLKQRSVRDRGDALLFDQPQRLCLGASAELINRRGTP